MFALMAKTDKTERSVTGARKVEPFNRQSIDLIKRSLYAQKAHRDLALFSLGVDLMLRGGDLVRLKVSDVRDTMGTMKDAVPVRQGKTGKSVKTYVSEATQKALVAMIKADDKWQTDYLFTAERAPHGDHMTETTLRRLVKDWARIAHLDASQYSSHSLRRSRPSIIYAETNNIEVCRQLLGHASVAATSMYLNVTDAEVEAIARRFEV